MIFSGNALSADLPELRLADAVRLVLAKNRDILVQETYIDSFQGQYLQAAAPFDFVLSSGADYSRLNSSPRAALDQIRSYSSVYEIGGSQLLRNGTTAAISLSTLFDRGGLPGDVRGREAVLNVTLIQPLLRGRGAKEVTAVEDAARLRVLASRQEFRTQISQVLHQTLLAYWTFRVRAALLQAAVSSEDRSRNLLASNKKLVDAAEKPLGDLVLLQADLADKVVVRQAAALALNDSRSALGRLMGLNAMEIGGMPAPTDPLPAAGEMRSLSPSELAALRVNTLARRSDLLALEQQIGAATRLTEAARQGMLPRLDLEVGVSYNKAMSGGDTLPEYAHRHSSGPSVVARLNYQFPIQNRNARGVLLDRSAQLTELQVLQRDLVSAVTDGVDTALESLRSSTEQLKTAQEALVLYEKAVNQEIVKQKNGISTLIDVINIETRFVNARINALQAQLAYASAVARLRLETDTLLPEPPGPDANFDRFTLDLGTLAGLGPLEKQLSVVR